MSKWPINDFGCFDFAENLFYRIFPSKKSENHPQLTPEPHFVKGEVYQWRNSSVGHFGQSGYLLKPSNGVANIQVDTHNPKPIRCQTSKRIVQAIWPHEAPYYEEVNRLK